MMEYLGTLDLCPVSLLLFGDRDRKKTSFNHLSVCPSEAMEDIYAFLVS